MNGNKGECLIEEEISRLAIKGKKVPLMTCITQANNH